MKSLFLALMMAGGILLSTPTETPAEPQETAPAREYMGVYEVTAYAGDGITATGTTPVPYKTVAVDPQVIPYGTQLYLEGVGIVTAEDCGGAIKGQRLDIYLPTEADCIQWGRQERKVWLVK